MKEANLKFFLLGLLSGVLCIIPSLVDLSFVNKDFALNFLFYGPGFIFGIAILLGVRKQRISILRKILCVFVTGLAYVAAVYAYYISLLLSGFIGGAIAGTSLKILNANITIKYIIVGSVLSSLLAMIAGTTWGEWFKIPNTQILFPLWQSVMALYFGWLLNGVNKVKLETKNYGRV